MRRLFRFRLRTLLLLLAVLGAVLAWYFSPTQRQRRAIAQLQLQGARIVFDYQIQGSGRTLMVDDEAPVPGPELLRQFLGDDYYRTPFAVSFYGTQITDETLLPLTALPSVRDLSLEETSITDDGLEHLATLWNLRSLNLSGTPITDDGLAHLTGLRNLRSLDLTGTRVTDNAVRVLSQFPNLSKIRVGKTAMTDAAIDRLQAAFPEADIWDSYGPISGIVRD